jgi:WD40 repeat protein
VAIGDRVAYVHDIDARITRRLEGQPAVISAIATPTPGFPYLLTGDVNGTVRVWEPSAPRARVIGRVPGLPIGTQFSPDGTLLAISTVTDPVIRLVRMADGSQIELRGHASMVGGMKFSRDGDLLLSYSSDGSARIWRTSDGALLRTFEGHRAIVKDAAFLDGTAGAVVSVGDDGQLLAWSVDGGDVRTLLSHRVPLVSLQVLSNTKVIVTRDVAGSIWSVASTGHTTMIRQGNGVEITSMRASRNGEFLAIGQEDGSVIVYRTASWTIATAFRAGGTVARVEFDPQNRELLLLSEDGFVHVIPLDARRRVAWRDFQVEAHDIAYTPGGDGIAISAADGGSWFYSIQHARWFYHRDHDAAVRSGRFTPDGTRFVSIDESGIIVSQDAATVLE